MDFDGKTHFHSGQVNDAMDMGMDNVDAQADDVYNGILGEIGLEYEMDAGKAATGKVKVAG